MNESTPIMNAPTEAGKKIGDVILEVASKH